LHGFCLQQDGILVSELIEQEGVMKGNMRNAIFLLISISFSVFVARAHAIPSYDSFVGGYYRYLGEDLSAQTNFENDVTALGLDKKEEVRYLPMG